VSVTVHVKVGDTAPAQAVELLGRDGTPANLTGATVVMQVRGLEGSSIACTIDSAADGTVNPGRGTLAPDAGDDSKDYDVEFEVTYSDATIQTFPEQGYAKLTVWRDLDAV